MKKHYSPNDIKTLTAAESIKLRPRLYFEQCFKDNNLNALLFEILCHAFDEYLDKNCNKIIVSVNKNTISIKYNAGMSLAVNEDNITKAELIMTSIMACSNLKKHLAVGHEFCNLGMAAINFASEKCKLTTVWQGQKGVFELENGETKVKQFSSFNPKEYWTEIILKPDPQIFGNLEFSTTGIKKRAAEITGRFTGLNIEIL